MTPTPVGSSGSHRESRAAPGAAGHTPWSSIGRPTRRSNGPVTRAPRVERPAMRAPRTSRARAASVVGRPDEFPPGPTSSAYPCWRSTSAAGIVVAVTTKDRTRSRRLDGGAGGVTPMVRSAAARRIARRASVRPERRARRMPHEPPRSTPAVTSSVPVGMKARAHGMGDDWAPCGARSTIACTTSAIRPATRPPSEERTAKNH